MGKVEHSCMSWDCQLAIDISSDSSNGASFVLDFDSNQDCHSSCTSPEKHQGKGENCPRSPPFKSGCKIKQVQRNAQRLLPLLKEEDSSFIACARATTVDSRGRSNMDGTDMKTLMPSLEDEDLLDDDNNGCLDGFNDALAKAEAEMDAMLSSFDGDIFANVQNKSKILADVARDMSDEDDTDEDVPPPVRNPADLADTFAEVVSFNGTSARQIGHGFKENYGPKEANDVVMLDSEVWKEGEEVLNSKVHAEPITPSAEQEPLGVSGSNFETSPSSAYESGTATSITTPEPEAGHNPADNYNTYTVAKKKAFSPYEEEVVFQAAETNEETKTNVTLDMETEDIEKMETGPNFQRADANLGTHQDEEASSEKKKVKEDIINKSDEENEDAFLPTTSIMNDTLPDSMPVLLPPPPSSVESPSPRQLNSKDVEGAPSDEMDSEDSEEMLLAFLPNTGKNSFTAEELASGKISLGTDSSPASKPPPTPASTDPPKSASKVGAAHLLLQRKGRIKETPKSLRVGPSRTVVPPTTSKASAAQSSNPSFHSSAAARARAKAKIASRNVDARSLSSNASAIKKTSGDDPSKPPSAKPSASIENPTQDSSSGSDSTNRATTARQARIRAASEKLKTGATGVPAVRKKTLSVNSTKAAKGTVSKDSSISSAGETTKLPASKPSKEKTGHQSPVARAANPNASEAVAKARERVREQMRSKRDQATTGKVNEGESTNGKGNSLSAAGVATSKPKSKTSSRASSTLFQPTASARIREAQTTPSAKKPKVSSTAIGVTNSKAGSNVQRGSSRLSRSGVAHSFPNGTSRLQRPTSSSSHRLPISTRPSSLDGLSRTKNCNERLSKNRASSETTQTEEVVKSSNTRDSEHEGDENDKLRSNSMDETASTAPTEIHSNHVKDSSSCPPSIIESTTKSNGGPKHTEGKGKTKDKTAAIGPEKVDGKGNIMEHSAANVQKSEKVEEAIKESQQQSLSGAPSLAPASVDEATHTTSSKAEMVPSPPGDRAPPQSPMPDRPKSRPSSLAAKEVGAAGQKPKTIAKKGLQPTRTTSQVKRPSPEASRARPEKEIAKRPDISGTKTSVDTRPKRSLTKEVREALAKRKAEALQKHKERTQQALSRRLKSRKSDLPPAPTMEEVLGHALPSAKKGHAATPTAASAIRLKELSEMKKKAAVVATDSKPRQLTIPAPPKLTTTERNGERVYSCAAHLDLNGSLNGSRPSSPARSLTSHGAGSVRTSASRDLKDLTLAERVGDYFAKSLRGEPSGNSSQPNSPTRSHNGLTIPKTPNVLKRSAAKKTPKLSLIMKSLQQREEEEVQYCQSHQFKARPVPEVLHRPPVPIKKASSATKAKSSTTKTRPFRLSLESRRVAPLPAPLSSDEIELSKKFKARPAPSSTRKPATIRPPLSAHASTPVTQKKTRPPRLSTSTRSDKRKASIEASEHRAALLTEEKKAAEEARRRHEAEKLRCSSSSKTPSVGGSASSSRKSTPTVPKPFHLQCETRGEVYHGQLEQRLQHEEESRRQSANFKALALPKPTKAFVPVKGQTHLTEPKEFHLLSEERHRKYIVEQERKLQEEEEQLRLQAEGPKANPIPKSNYVESFFVVKPSEVGRPKIEGKAPEFASEKQIEHRKMFDLQVKERLAQQEQIKKQQLEAQKKQEEEEVHELRRLPVSQGGYQVEAKPINAVFQQRSLESRNRRSRAGSMSTLSTHDSASPTYAQAQPFVNAAVRARS